MMAHKQYVIKWRAVKTNAEGQGTGRFTLAEAEKIAEALNKENAEVTVHWVVLAEDES